MRSNRRGYGGRVQRMWRSATMTVLVVTALLLSGCVASPEVEPSATPPFASDAEAFAAAEETYRAYVDALNQVDLSDPATFEAVYAWTTGEANAAARESFSQMHADGWVVEGPSSFHGFHGVAYTPDIGEVTGNLCLDVSNVAVWDKDGGSVVPADRPNQRAVEVTFELDATLTGFAISESIATESPCD